MMRETKQVLRTLGLCSVAMAAGTCVAAAVEVPRAEATLSQVTGLQPDGSYMIVLWYGVPMGWHTYWRTPGDTGMAPQFSFAGSTNVKSTEVLFPVPGRSVEDGSASLVYAASPSLPVRVMPLDPGLPGRLVANVAYGVCKDICVPEKAHAETGFGPSAPLADTTVRNRFLGTMQEIPHPETPADAVRVTGFAVERDSAGQRFAAIDIAVPDNGTRVGLFAEGPPEWALPQPSERVDDTKPSPMLLSPPPAPGKKQDAQPLVRRFVVSLQNVPDDAPLQGKSLRLTLASPFGNTEAIRTFP